MSVILVAITAIAGIGGVAIGGWIAVQGQRKERRQQRIRQQLDEFYGPMLLGMRATILAKSELRKHIADLASEEWPKLFEGITEPDAKKEIEDRFGSGTGNRRREISDARWCSGQTK